MLRINQQRSSHGAKSYFNEGLAREDYYTKDQIVGRWGGKGADRLGLEGPVTPEAFHALCDNLNPVTGQKLTCRTRADRRVGWDMNFHAPKSLSVLYTLTEDQQLLDAFRDSVKGTMQELEEDVRARVRKGGRNEERVTGNMVYGEFVHLTSRPVDGVPDPHLHAHCFVFNATHDQEEGKWKAAELGAVVRDAVYYEAAFHARLSRRVAELGYGVERTKNGWEVAGFDRATLEKYSRRTAEVEKEAAAKGITSPEEKARLGAKTREKKGAARSLAELQAEWKGRLGLDERQRFSAIAARRIPSAERPATPEVAVEHALKHGFERAAVVPGKRLLATALKRGYGSVRPEDVKRSFQSRKGVIRQQSGGQTLVTTKEVLAEEAAVIAFARDGRGTCKPIAKGDVSFEGSELNEQQQAAVRHIMQSRDRVMLVRGAAGTGKSSLLRAAARTSQARGNPVHVFAPTTEAAGVLRRDGFAEAQTVARLIADKKAQEAVRGGLLVIDEAALVGTRDMKEVFRVASAQDARVLLLGDHKQHAAIPRGTPFRLLQTHAGIKPVEVRDILRQKGQYKAAVECLARGDVAAGFERLDSMGAIQAVPDETRHIRLAADYIAAAGKGKSCLVIAPTHREGQAVTERIRARLKEEGQLGQRERAVVQQVSFGMTEAERADAVNYRAGDLVQIMQNCRGGFRKGERWEVEGHDAKGQVLVKRGKGKAAPLPLTEARHYDVYEKKELRLSAGDRIRITQNGMAVDGERRLINGSIHTVNGFDAKGNILLEKGLTVPKDYGNLAHGYCTTSHSSQGKTVDKVLLALGRESFAAAGQEQFYVSVSRAREGVQIYCTDKQELLSAVSRSQSRMSATELTAEAPQQTARSRFRLWRSAETLRRQERAEERRPTGVVKDQRPRQLPQQERKRQREIER